MRGRSAHPRGEENTTHLPHGRVTCGYRSSPHHGESKVQRARNRDAESRCRQYALRTGGFRAESTVLKDIVIESIVGVAEEWDADLIVLGWHGRTLLKRFLFGSVATAVIHAAPCSVELVRFRPERWESEACRLAERGES